MLRPGAGQQFLLVVLDELAGPATSSYGLLQAGTITVITGSGRPLTLTPGPTWFPHHILRGVSRRAILIHLDAREIRQILAGQ